MHIPRHDQEYAVDVGLRMLMLRHLVTQEDGLYRANPKETALLALLRQRHRPSSAGGGGGECGGGRGCVSCRCAQPLLLIGGENGAHGGADDTVRCVRPWAGRRR